jgi:magnesium transporter
MLRIYEAIRNQFTIQADLDALELRDNMIWLDLINPTVEEERKLESLLGFDLPTRDELKDIEPSSRLYEENGKLYMTATVLWKAETDKPEAANIGFILTADRLITIRYAEPRPFNSFAAYAAREGNSCTDAASTLINLLEAIIDRAAEILEITGAEIDDVTNTIFQGKRDPKKRRSPEELETILHTVALKQNMTAKVRDSLVSLGRMAGFVTHASSIKDNQAHMSHMISLAQDIKSLTDHASFLSSNLNFMLEASLGLINIEQNAIIKIFSVAAVVFLPPTLVASIYGMNFRHMPELDWHLGYPLAILLMVFSAIAPYLWFKKKGWL